jgi:drug/metabolite transporter (DMT)-like permease
VTSIGHLGAVRYIPVSLAAVIFYTFPLQVIAWKRLVHRQAVSRYELIGFGLAFAGIALALGPQFQQMDVVGLLLAISGSLGATVFILSYERFPGDIDSWTASLWITLGTVVLCILSLFAGFELSPPREVSGWMFLGAIALCSVASFLFALVAIRKIGGAVFALFLNFEPVMILTLAWLVIGEELSSERIIGIAMVVIALVISQWKNPALAVESHG